MKAKQAKPKKIFYAIAIALPFVLLGLLEAALRLAGYGASYPLFVPVAHTPEYIQPNPDIIKRFFYPASLAPAVAPDTYHFTHNKPVGTLRIVTLGGSTMAGFPYGRFGSPGGMLKQRISATHPELNVEIISVAMSSINTFSILDFTDEVIAISPDAVLIYAGHNEFLGVMGLGSSFAGKGSYAAKLLFLTLKDWRVYQLLQHSYNLLITPKPQSPLKADDRTLMAQIAKEKDIVYKSPLFEAGRAQFAQNLGIILAEFTAANVPAFVSTIASNERDQAPFNSVSDLQLDAATAALSNALLGVVAAENNINRLQTHNQNIFHADFEYTLARTLLSTGNHKTAAQHYSNARDYDLLRFRAPSEFNTIIKQSTDAPMAYLVDAHARLVAETDSGIIGNDLMLEHLHPNARGYFVISEAFYIALISHGILPEATYPVSSELAWRWQPISVVDETYAAFKIAQLMSDYPFSDEPKPITLADIDTNKLSKGDVGLLKARINGDSFLVVQQRLIESLQRDQRFLAAGIAAGVLFEALPQQHGVARIASLLLLRENALELALYYAIRASRLQPSNTNYTLTLAEILYKLNRIQAAIDKLDEVLSQDPNHAKAKQIKRAISR